MKSSRLAATCAAATLVFAGSTLSDSLFSGSLVARAMPAQAQPREIAFESAGDFLNLPADTYFGEVAGVATTSTGNIWVYTQSGGPNATVGASRVYINGGPRLFEFDKAGKFLREIGTKDDNRPYNFLFAQGVRVDPQNNIWVVDRASRMVVKFDQSGRILLTLGRRPEAIGEIGSSAGSGVYGRGSGPPGSGVPGDNFNQPTDVAWDAAGNIFVPDGYANARVAKFDKTGKFNVAFGWGVNDGKEESEVCKNKTKCQAGIPGTGTKAKPVSFRRLSKLNPSGSAIERGRARATSKSCVLYPGAAIPSSFSSAPYACEPTSVRPALVSPRLKKTSRTAAGFLSMR